MFPRFAASESSDSHSEDSPDGPAGPARVRAVAAPTGPGLGRGSGSKGWRSVACSRACPVITEFPLPEHRQ